GANCGLERSSGGFLLPSARGVVIDPPDGILPYQGWAREERNDRILPHRGYDDPTAHCFVAGIPRSHYVPSPFQADRPVSLKGTVTEMKWSNPHGWIYIDVRDENGAVTNWALETSAANALIRRGWRKEDLPAGTVLLVEGWQARNGSATANIRSVTFEDGRRLFAGTSNPGGAGD